MIIDFIWKLIWLAERIYQQRNDTYVSEQEVIHLRRRL